MFALRKEARASISTFSKSSRHSRYWSRASDNIIALDTSCLPNTPDVRKMRTSVSPLSLSDLNLSNSSQLQSCAHHKRPTLSSIHQIRLQKDQLQARTQKRNSKSQAQTRIRPQTQKKPQRSRRRLWRRRHTPRLRPAHRTANEQAPSLRPRRRRRSQSEEA